MDKLIQTEVCSIIYGKFRDEENEELFRCPRQNDDTDIARYINEYRSLVCPMDSDVPFVDDDTEDLRNVEGKTMIGYWRMYFRDGYWQGRWMLEEGKPETIDCIGVDNILNWIYENFKKGCDYYMEDFFHKHFKEWGRQRYLIKPFMSEHYKVMVDTKYGNGDYPVRIYVYRNK